MGAANWAASDVASARGVGSRACRCPLAERLRRRSGSLVPQAALPHQPWEVGTAAAPAGTRPSWAWALCSSALAVEISFPIFSGFAR